MEHLLLDYPICVAGLLLAQARATVYRLTIWDRLAELEIIYYDIGPTASPHTYRYHENYTQREYQLDRGHRQTPSTPHRLRVICSMVQVVQWP